MQALRRRSGRHAQRNPVVWRRTDARSSPRIQPASAPATGREYAGTRRSFLGWMVAAAAACLVVGTIEVARSSALRRPELRSEHAQPGTGVPPDMMVVVSEDGKLFHVAGCDIYPRKNEAADDHRRRSVAAGLLSLCALHEEVPGDRVMSHPMERRASRPSNSLQAVPAGRGRPRSTSISVTFVRLPNLLKRRSNRLPGLKEFVILMSSFYSRVSAVLLMVTLVGVVACNAGDRAGRRRSQPCCGRHAGDDQV